MKNRQNQHLFGKTLGIVLATASLVISTPTFAQSPSAAPTKPATSGSQTTGAGTRTSLSHSSSWPRCWPPWPPSSCRPPPLGPRDVPAHRGHPPPGLRRLRAWGCRRQRRRLPRGVWGLRRGRKGSVSHVDQGQGTLRGGGMGGLTANSGHRCSGGTRSS